MPASKSKVDTKQLFKNWQRWPIESQPVLIKKFTEGKNHHCYLIHSGNQKLVLKVSTTSLKSSIEIQRWANKLGIAPNVLFSEDHYRLILMEYVPKQDNSKKDNIELLANALQTLHRTASRPFGKTNQNIDLQSAFNQYLAPCDKQIHDIHKQLNLAINILVNDQTPFCFCHNDLVSENCLFNNKANLIDWEFAQDNSPWFDLASVIIYHDLNHNESIHFLNAYDSIHSNSSLNLTNTQFAQKVNTPIFHASQIVVLWLDILWHLFKFDDPYAMPKLKSQYSQLVRLSKRLNIDLPSKNTPFIG